MAVYGYARFSSAGQTTGNSIERQQELAEAYAAQRGWHIDEWFIDKAKSAFHAVHKTGRFGEILRRIKSGEIGNGDTLLVEHVDRLSREKARQAMATLNQIIDAGVTVITVMDGQAITAEELDDRWTDIISVMARMAAAHDESKKKSERAHDNWKRLRANGIMVTTPPAWMTFDLEPIADRVDDIRFIFDLAERGHGCRSIATALHKDGRTAWTQSRATRSDKPWTTATVQTLLKNRALIGECQPTSKGQPFGPLLTDYFPRVIEVAQFADVQRLMSTRTFGTGGRRSSRGNIFKGWLKCGCGQQMIISQDNSRRVLVCENRSAEEHPLVNRVDYDQLEAGVLKGIREMRLTN